MNTSGSDEHNKSTGGSSGSGGGASTGNLFAVGEAQDKGLADIETGSEVYMSELLVRYFYPSLITYCDLNRLGLTWRILMKLRRQTKKILSA